MIDIKAGYGITHLDKSWSQSDAVHLCKCIEEVCPAAGCHVALTGGVLYKPGLRKDVDILFYRIRQVDSIDLVALFSALEKIDVLIEVNHGWCVKATYKGKDIDMFFPESEGLVYPSHTSTLEDS